MNDEAPKLFDLTSSGELVKDWETPTGKDGMFKVVDEAPELFRKYLVARDCAEDMVCWQYKIRQKHGSGANRQLDLIGGEVDTSLKHVVVRPTTKEVAEPFIKQYEWLGTLGQFSFGYGLYFPYLTGVEGHKLGGVACFSKTTTWQAEVSICGEKYRDKVILLCRGACAEWTPSGSASGLISAALKLVEKDTPYRIVLAYSDRRAGEVGTVYQATGWYFIGWGATGTDYVPRKYFDTTDVKFHTRGLPKELKSKRRLLANGEEVIAVPRANKGRYIYLLGSHKERKELLVALRYRILPYPKREDFNSPTKLARFNAVLR